MRSTTPNLNKWWILPALLVTAILSVPGVLSHASAQSKPKATGPKTFATPQQAAQALIQAAETYNVPALTEIFGSDAKDLVTSEDPVEDKNRAADFAKLAREKQSIDIDPMDPNYASLVVGPEDWPLPIPLIKHSGKWAFDPKIGREEILFRRIGGNELDAIRICRGYVEAQIEYALQRHDGSTVNEYAQRIISTPGRHDGLAWQNADGTWGGPVGEGVAKAIEQGYSERILPYHGYYFKVLRGQGAAAPLGQMDFVVNGAMIGGFALAAAPAQYKVTGVKSFVISHEGILYEKDLGPNTLVTFKAMDRYNPDKTWHPTDEEQ